MAAGMHQEQMDNLFSTFEYIKVSVEHSAATTKLSAQDQRNEFQGTKSRDVPHNTEELERLCGQFEFPLADFESVPVCPVMDLGSLPSLVPGAQVGDSGFGTGAEGCCQCPEEDYRGDDGRSVRMSPYETPISQLERQQQKLNDGRGNNCAAVFQNVQKDPLGHVSQKLNDRYVNNYGAVFQKVKKDPLGHVPQKLNDRNANNNAAVFQKVQKDPLGHVPQKPNDRYVNNYGAVFQKVQKNKVPQKLNDRYVNNYGAVFQRVQKNPAEQIVQKIVMRGKMLEVGGVGLYDNCDCRRTNGLQDDCRQTSRVTNPPTYVQTGRFW
jgi:hypothetical protein